MLPVNFSNLQSILCLGAHSDDIEIGCGGTLMQLLTARPNVEVHWVVFSAIDSRAAEATTSANKLLTTVSKKNIVLHEFRDTCFPFVGLQIKERFIQLQRDVRPDLVFTHRHDDMHQDHRLLGELTCNAFRDHLILEYEIPKYDGDMRPMNCFIPLEEATAQRKTGHLLEHFPSQHAKPWFKVTTFEALMRLRGIECNAPSGMAEAFYCRKMVLAP